MKKIFYTSIVIAIIFAACYKPPAPRLPVPSFNAAPDSGYLPVVQKYLRQHPNVAIYDSVDFNRYRISKQQKCWYLRLPFKNEKLSAHFILFQTDSLGVVADGRIVHLEKTVPGQPSANFNGSISTSSIDQKTIIKSKISGGYIESLHPAMFASKETKAQSFPVPIVDELPEVVVVGYNSSQSVDGGLSWSDYIMLQSIFSGGGGGSSPGSAGGGNGSAGGDAGTGYGVYNPVDYGDGNGIYQTSGGVTPHQDPHVTLSFDESYSRPAIDINAWLKCFTNIPDAGATSTITLYGDLPVDGDPSVGLNIWNGNTGHCFLQLSKTNGSQSVTQVIGFTAQSAGQAIINADAFVPSKIVDNAGHKYNCSITMPLSAAGMNLVISTIQSQAAMPYSIVNYDCLDFGLHVFNSVRPNPLVISKKYDPNDPFSNIATGPKLYTLLSTMIDNGSGETPNITVSGSKYIGVSHGACN